MTRTLKNSKISLSIMKRLLLITILIFGAVSSAHSQESQTAEALMGVSIQKYLEGDMKNTISNLTELLTKDPQNSRAKSLLKKAANRLIDATEKDKNYDSSLPFLELALKSLPGESELTEKVQKIGSLANPQLAAVKAAKKALSKPKSPVVTTGVSSAKFNQLNRYLKKIEKNISSVSNTTDVKLTSQFKQLYGNLDVLQSQIKDIEQSNKKNTINFWIVFILSALTIIALAMLYITLKADNLNLIKNMVRERKAVEDMKSAYNKDTAELSKRLVMYGKSQQRAGELEKNWEKIIDILTKLTEGGSTHKVVLTDSPSGRKAVTGIDPRTRARADSVEVIAEIFRDSPKATEMLEPFLEDNDNRTKANAAVAYYRYDPEKAITVIQEMAVSKDKWMRLSAAWAMGELADSSTSRILERLLEDPDAQVKNKARISLEKILGN